MAREMVRRRVVSISAVAILGLALMGALLTAMNSQPAFAKTTLPGAMRQTGTTDTTGMTGGMMTYSEMESTGHAMTHLIMALDTLEQMQQQHQLNMNSMNSMTGDTTGAGMGMMASTADLWGDD